MKPFAALAVVAVLVAAGASARFQDGDAAEQGRRVFLTQCYGCHTLGAAGTPIAPDLSRIGARLTRGELERRIRDPQTHKPSARMPRLDLTEADVQVLAAYLSSLR